MNRKQIKIRSIQYVYDPEAGEKWMDIFVQAVLRVHREYGKKGCE